MNSNNNKINNSKIEKDLDNALLKRALGYEYECECRLHAV